MHPTHVPEIIETRTVETNQQSCGISVKLFNTPSTDATTFTLYNKLAAIKDGEDEACAGTTDLQPSVSTSWGCTLQGQAWLYFVDYDDDYYGDYYDKKDNDSATVSIPEADFNGVYSFTAKHQDMPAGYQTIQVDDVNAIFEMKINDKVVYKKEKGFGSDSDITVAVENCEVVTPCDEMRRNLRSHDQKS